MKVSKLEQEPTHDILLNADEVLVLIVEQVCASSETLQKGLGVKLEAISQLAEETPLQAIGATLAADGYPGAAGICSRAFPKLKMIDVNSSNPWENAAFRELVIKHNRRRLIVGGLASEGIVSITALCGLEEGYDVYLLTDCIVGSDYLAHRTAIKRMLQAGVVPLTLAQLGAEIHRKISNPGVRQKNEQ